jgi:amino acid transporter
MPDEPVSPEGSGPPQAVPAAPRATRVVVATSVMLSFISFWRAAAIVLADLGSSAFYAGGIAEQAVGRAAPWFILGVMLFSYAVRAVYIESCSMFTRGGVYRVVKEALGGTVAKLSVSALMFDYILTGPISAVSAGQYIVGFIAQTVTYFGHPWHPDKAQVNLIAAGLAVLVTAYFWWRNTQGIHESSDDALKIIYVATPMVVLMILWGAGTLLSHPDKQRLPPPPVARNLSFNSDAVGWMPKLLPGSFVHQASDTPNPTGSTPKPADTAPHAPSEDSHFGLIPQAGSLLGLLGILIAMGHSILAMSGEETLAQVNRELEYPKHKNLMRAGFVIFVYSLAFTCFVSFFAYALIPDHVRPQYFDNLIAGISMNLAGPFSLRLIFQAYVVLVGVLLLSSAVNTAIIGSNAVLNRISEDGVLTPWFRAPHKRYGTTYRTINMIAILQISTIALSRGEVYVLGEAYAFGVIWSFAFNSLSMLVLRFKDKSPREWKVPFNVRIGGREIPFGLGSVAVVLFTLAGVNMITKQVATISGLAITAVFSTIFFVSERINARRHERRAGLGHALDQFRLQPQEAVSPETLQIRPGSTLCPVRDYNNLDHVRRALEITHTGKQDLVVMTVHLLRGPNTGYRDLREDRLFTDYEQLLFSRVVSLAEKAGKHVDLMVIPSSNPFQAIVQAAAQLVCAEIIMGRSMVISPREQALRLGEAWEALPHRPRHQVRLRVIESEGRVHEFVLGAHPPTLTTRDINLIHDLWFGFKDNLPEASVRHRDVVALALRRLEREMQGKAHASVVKEMAELKSAERPEDLT